MTKDFARDRLSDNAPVDFQWPATFVTECTYHDIGRPVWDALVEFSKTLTLNFSADMSGFVMPKDPRAENLKDVIGFCVESNLCANPCFCPDGGLPGNSDGIMISLHDLIMNEIASLNNLGYSVEAIAQERKSIAGALRYIADAIDINP